MGQHIREQACYLVVSPKQWTGLSVRVAARAPALKSDEVAIEVTLKLPDAIFKRPALKATVEVPAEHVSRPVIDAVVLDNVRAEIEKQTGLDITIALVEPTE